ncbi:Hypothetical_protein [Hexamita inflata]|uniref:Hypothetical_protein n=1 Tax=Hexamita inflata TaxID=28002 RepID=A0ABP1LMK8_9EUKA
MEQTPQEQEQKREALIEKPDYLTLHVKDAVKIVQKEENNWFKIEAWLWNILFPILVFGFKIPQKLISSPMNKTFLYLLSCVSVVFLTFITFESVYAKLFGQKFVEKAAYVNATLFFILPICWIAVMFKEIGWLCLLVAFNGFMIVVMWPHAMSVFDDAKLYVSAQRQIKEQKLQGLKQQNKTKPE